MILSRCSFGCRNEEAGGPEQQDEDQHDERDDHRLRRAHPNRGVGFQQADEDGGGNRAPKAPHAADHDNDALQEIWMAETKKDALAAFDAFVGTWAVKYDKAVECLIKDRDALLAFYDFPAD